MEKNLKNIYMYVCIYIYVVTAAAAASFEKSIAVCDDELGKFDVAVKTFSDGIHDFSEVDYNLRGTGAVSKSTVITVCLSGSIQLRKAEP